MQIENIDENLSMNISDTSGVSLQVSDVDTSLEMSVNDEKNIINLNIINEESNISMEVENAPSKIEGTSDHSKLENLDYEHSGHTGFQPAGDYALKDDVPTKISELYNDSGFISGYTETDPTVPQHVKEITKENIEQWNKGKSYAADDNVVIENDVI